MNNVGPWTLQELTFLRKNIGIKIKMVYSILEKIIVS
jgi:hypothetical protein